MPPDSRPAIWEHARSRGVSRRDFLAALPLVESLVKSRLETGPDQEVGGPVGTVPR
jgi:hypothetical protein